MAVSVENSRGAPNFPPNFEVLVGTYEEFVLGFKLNKNPEGVSVFRTLSHSPVVCLDVDRVKGDR